MNNVKVVIMHNVGEQTNEDMNVFFSTKDTKHDDFLN